MVLEKGKLVFNKSIIVAQKREKIVGGIFRLLRKPSDQKSN